MTRTLRPRFGVSVTLQVDGGELLVSERFSCSILLIHHIGVSDQDSSRSSSLFLIPYRKQGLLDFFYMPNEAAANPVRQGQLQSQ
ncbi:MAG: hypothetical protein IJ831_05635 [Spirochaetales bacterium]|nr:hypothetical protein [Spirochaetales bacterium]